MNTLGVALVWQARRLGIKSHLPRALSLALGACEVTPLEMATAYNTVASHGIYSRPHLVLRVRDRNGSILYKHTPV